MTNQLCATAEQELRVVLSLTQAPDHHGCNGKVIYIPKIVL